MEEFTVTERMAAGEYDRLVVQGMDPSDARASVSFRYGVEAARVQGASQQKRNFPLIAGEAL